MYKKLREKLNDILTKFKVPITSDLPMPSNKEKTIGSSHLKLETNTKKAPYKLLRESDTNLIKVDKQKVIDKLDNHDIDYTRFSGMLKISPQKISPLKKNEVVSHFHIQTKSEEPVKIKPLNLKRISIKSKFNNSSGNFKDDRDDEVNLKRNFSERNYIENKIIGSYSNRKKLKKYYISTLNIDSRDNTPDKPFACSKNNSPFITKEFTLQEPEKLEKDKIGCSTPKSSNSKFIDM